MKKQILAGVALAIVATQALAQQSVMSPRAAAAETRYVLALCSLQGGSKSTGEGLKVLKKAYEAKSPAKRAESLGMARSMILQGITAEGAAGSSNAWHHLARTYMAIGDLTGADSAFARAEALAPDCSIDINQHRQNTWSLVANDGLKFMRGQQVEVGMMERDVRSIVGEPDGASSSKTANGEEVMWRYGSGSFVHFTNGRVSMVTKGEADELSKRLRSVPNPDSALALFGQANTIFRGMPQVFSNVGVIYANRQQDDSAATYFAKALEAALKDTALKAERDNAATNLSIMYTRSNRPADAVKVLRRIVGWNPADNDAKKQLSEAFRAAGMNDSATALEGELVESFSKANFDSLSVQDLLSLGVGMFNASKFPEAANAFDAVVKRNPNSRDGLYNLANSFYAMKEHAKLVDVGSRLHAIDPLNGDVLRLLGMAYKELKQQDLLIKTAEKLVGLPVVIEVNGFSMGRTSASWSALATGHDPMDVNGKPIKAAPVTLVIEFLDDKGALISTAEVVVPAMTKGETKNLSAKGAGENISAWRYHQK